MSAFRVDCEGLDGVGKTTAWQYIINNLESEGYYVLKTREVGNPNILACVKMRELVLNPENKLDGMSMELIFAAMRIENEKFYASIKDNYDFIISDRGWFSHLSYTDHNVSAQFTQDFYIDVIRHLAPLPDAVVYLQADPAIALSRRQKRGTTDVIEMKGEEFQLKVGASFEDYFTSSTTKPENLFRVSANESLDEVRRKLDTVIEKLIGLAQANELKPTGT